MVGSNEVVGILGNGEIGRAVGRICREAGYKTLVRELTYDEMEGKRIDYLHVNIPEKRRPDFVGIVVKNIVELKPKLTIINSSCSVGATREIYEKVGLPIVHSPVIGVHPHLYESIKFHFKKIIGPVDKKSLVLAKAHFKKMGLKIEIYDSSENSEAAKLLDLVYYAWNIVFCKWMDEMCKKMGVDFDQVYTRHNQIYNEGYKKLRPNVVRPVLVPTPGPITGHCTIPDTELVQRDFPNRLTEFILKENKKYHTPGV